MDLYLLKEERYTVLQVDDWMTFDFEENAFFLTRNGDRLAFLFEGGLIEALSVPFHCKTDKRAREEFAAATAMFSGFLCKRKQSLLKKWDIYVVAERPTS